MLSKPLKLLHILEDSLLVSLVLAIIIVGAMQIILRNANVGGITWIDPAMRVGILWLAMFGALRASREQKHIVIDLLSHYSRPSIQKVIGIITAVSTAIICFIAAYYSVFFVYGEMQDGGNAFLKVPEWVCVAIIPVSLFLIGLRSLYAAFSPLAIVFLLIVIARTLYHFKHYFYF